MIVSLNLYFINKQKVKKVCEKVKMKTYWSRTCISSTIMSHTKIMTFEQQQQQKRIKLRIHKFIMLLRNELQIYNEYQKYNIVPISWAITTAWKNSLKVVVWTTPPDDWGWHIVPTPA